MTERTRRPCCAVRPRWSLLRRRCWPAAAAATPPRPSAAPTTAAGVGKVTVAPDGVQEITLQTQDDYVFTPDHFTVAPGRCASPW